MSVWFAIPSARPNDQAESVLDAWRRQGYRIALLRQGDPITADLLFLTQNYQGWALSTNTLAREIIKSDPEAEWIVGGGDDYFPDPEHAAKEIAHECTTHFGSTMGVMQPTGDRWGEDEAWAIKAYPDAPAYIDRICGSPWMGRDFCRRMYQGSGPMFSGYVHMFADEELQCVAKARGLLWQRRDLVQLHNHWSRNGSKSAPAFLSEVNSRRHWEVSRSLFKSRQRLGFPGHEPIA